MILKGQSGNNSRKDVLKTQIDNLQELIKEVNGRNEAEYVYFCKEKRFRGWFEKLSEAVELAKNAQ